MKKNLAIIAIFAALNPVNAEDEGIDKTGMLVKHAEGSERLADEQDELSADVQQLVIEQTVPQVIELLTEVEGIMDEATDYLAELDTGGQTIAAQTEIIEKIHQAAKAKQAQSGAGKPGSAMMDMMERMMGMKPGEGEGQGKGKGDKPGDKPGQGQTGESDAENSVNGGGDNGNSEERRIPKAAGSAGKSLPSEFQKALDAYNRGLEEIGE